MITYTKWRYRVFNRAISIYFIGLFVFFVADAYRVPDLYAGQMPGDCEILDYKAEVLKSAREKELHEKHYWHVLVHYKKSLFGFKSIIDDPKFFLAVNGRTNPEAELLATIRAFFETPGSEGDEKETAACRFVARFEWIKEQLALDLSRMPVPGCTEFDAFMVENAPKSATLAFPTSHINSPASMFGHTLLTIETKDKTHLLAYSVSYAAETDETFGPAFAIKGLFGLYRGYFSVLPYYVKLQQYNDLDHRDIWEYRLNLTETEIRRMMLHIREWDTIGCRYYFFTKNCSYLLYLLLEVARPSVNLTDEAAMWVIPLDSIRQIRKAGLISDEVVYRPSKTTKINHLASLMSGNGRDIAISLATEDNDAFSYETFGETGFPDREKMLVCELAAEYVRYLYTKGSISRETYRNRYLKILNIRSRLGLPEAEALYSIETPLPPDQGHGSARLAGGTVIFDGDGFFELRLRPAYHHIMDYPGGYVKNSQIIFADTVLRYDMGSGTLRLERFDLIDIVSISPRNHFFKPLSWKVSTGLKRVVTGDAGGRSLVYQLNPGSGFAFDLGSLGVAYAMLETAANFGGALEKNHALGIGASAGILKQFQDAWNVHAYGRNLYFGMGDAYNEFQAGIAQSFAITANHAISADVSRRKERGYYWTEATILFNLFF